MPQNHGWTQIIINWFPVLLLAGVAVFFLARGRAGMPKDVQPEVKNDKAAVQGIAYLAMSVLLLALSWFNALSVPWTWTANQVGAVGLLICVSIIGVGMGRIWWLGGYPALKARVTRIGQTSSGAPNLTWKSVLLWTVIAVAVVFVVNWLQQNRIG